MKRSIVVALLCTFVPLAVANPTKPRPVPPKPVPVVNAPVSSANSNQSVVNPVSPSSMSSSSSAGGSAQAISSGTGTASTGPVNAGSSVNVEPARLAPAPDVISYPTVFAEGTRGVIKPGYRADLVLLENDLFAIPPEEIAAVQVRATIAGGEFGYQSSR